MARGSDVPVCSTSAAQDMPVHFFMWRSALPGCSLKLSCSMLSWLIMHVEFYAHDFMIIWWLMMGRSSTHLTQKIVGLVFWLVGCGVWYLHQCGRKEARREESAAGATFQIKFRGSIFQDTKHLWCHQSSSEHQKANTKKRTPNTQIKRFDAIPDTKFPKES